MRRTVIATTAIALIALAGCGTSAPRQAAHYAGAARCHLRGHGLEVVPDPRCNHAVWVDDGAGVCKSGYNPRPPESVTEPIKRATFGRYGIALSQLGRYELDHLGPRWLGGATVAANLWPEPDGGPQSAYVHNPKDALEDSLFKRVCWYHSMSVQQARKVFEGDWRKARL